jgi:hypothetical protein
MSFWGSMFGGSNPTLNAAKTQAGQVAGFGTTKGEGLTTAAGNFFSDLMSGDSSKTAKLLAPQIKAQQDQAQQAKNTSAQFANRSGGTNARNQTIDDKTRANFGTMVSDLTGKAAGQAAQMGQSLLDTGISALKDQVNFSQQQMDNWSNSIFGQGMSSGAGFLEASAMGA